MTIHGREASTHVPGPEGPLFAGRSALTDAALSARESQLLCSKKVARLGRPLSKPPRSEEAFIFATRETLRRYGKLPTALS